MYDIPTFMIFFLSVQLDTTAFLWQPPLPSNSDKPIYRRVNATESSHLRFVTFFIQQHWHGHTSSTQLAVDEEPPPVFTVMIMMFG